MNSNPALLFMTSTRKALATSLILTFLGCNLQAQQAADADLGRLDRKQDYLKKRIPSLGKTVNLVNIT